MGRSSNASGWVSRSATLQLLAFEKLWPIVPLETRKNPKHHHGIDIDTFLKTLNVEIWCNVIICQAPLQTQTICLPQHWKDWRMWNNWWSIELQQERRTHHRDA